MTRLSDAYDKAYEMIGHTSSSSNITTTDMTIFINMAYRKIYMQDNIDWKWLLSEDNSKTLGYTTTKTATTSTGTSLYMTATTNFATGQRVIVDDSEYTIISSLGTGNPATVSLTLDGSYTSGKGIGAFSVLKPTDFIKLDALFIKRISDYKLIYLEPEDEKTNDYIQDGNYSIGTPSKYMERDTEIIFDKGVDENYRVQLRFYKKPADISASVDPAFLSIWDDVLSYFAAAMAFIRQGKRDEAGIFMNEFRNGLRDMKSFNNTNPDSRLVLRRKKDLR